MSDVIKFVVNYFANSLWQLPLFLTAGYAARRFIRRAGPLAQHRLWVITLILAAVIPALSAGAGLVSLKAALSGRSAHVITFGPANAVGSSLSRHASVELHPVLIHIVLYAYLALAAYLLARMLWSLRRTWALARTADSIPLRGDAAELWQNCQRAFCISDVAVLTSNDIAGPVTVGSRRACLLVPLGFFDNWQREDIAAALGHECAHIERRDFLLNLLYEAISLPIAYHPVSWMLKSRIAETRELVCDAMAAERIAGSAPYARSLLRIASTIYARPTRATAHAIGMFDANVLEKRIMNLMQKKQSLSRQWKIAMPLLAILVLAITCLTANAFTTTVDQQTSAGATNGQEESTAGKVYKVGGDVKAPRLISSVDPAFPEEARKKKISGICVVGLIVDQSGTPQQLHIVRSLAPAFDTNAINAVKQWRFAPATLNGKPVAVNISTEITFKFY
jgi:TonB family protein